MLVCVYVYVIHSILLYMYVHSHFVHKIIHVYLYRYMYVAHGYSIIQVHTHIITLYTSLHSYHQLKALDQNTVVSDTKPQVRSTSPLRA